MYGIDWNEGHPTSTRLYVVPPLHDNAMRAPLPPPVTPPVSEQISRAVIDVDDTAGDTKGIRSVGRVRLGTRPLEWPPQTPFLLEMTQGRRHVADM